MKVWMRSVISRGLDRGYRIFLRICIEIADDQKVGIATAGGVCRQPVDERRGCPRPGQIAIALTIARVRICNVVAR